ncbi:uncharacterized protein J3D65DRAFT_580047 [Phyllosticta citribraziliensis]|uniref:TPR-like protein n=1 Tax=Phyllosticta citribraziliensis TaxID=989973 RepID=A0ABR1L5T5_9PEZI
MAPGAKAALKAAKAALDAQNWDEAAAQAQAVLDADPQNYFAKLMLGRAYEKKGDLDHAAKAYTDAATTKPGEDQAWLGLRSLYEAQGAKKLDEYGKVGLKLAEIYANGDDLDKAQTALDKVVDLARAQGTKAQYRRALEVYLPTSPVYESLEGRVPHPAHTYTRIAEIVEEEEKQRVNKEIGERRTRLGARVAQVTTEVKREVYGRSDLEDIYRNVIDWTNDDETRRQYEEKLLQRAYETLSVLPAEQKGDKRPEVVDLANGMVIIKHPFALAWEIELEWKDVEALQEYDANVVREFVDFFPGHGLSRLLKGYLTSDISPFPLKLPQEQKEDDEKKEEEPPMSPEDRLLLMTEGFDDAKQSVLAHRLMGEYYLYLEEYESAMEVSRKGLKLVAAESQKSGLSLQNSRDVMNSTLATSLIHYQSPKNHPEAKSIFNDILLRKPSFTPALIGVGLIYEEEEKYAEAIDFLGRALKREPENARIGAEAAWCKALNGDHTIALAELEKYLEMMKTTDSRSRQLRALTLYRIGICIWEIDPTRQARKDRTGAYASFLQAIKTDPSLAPAYTSLGIFYSDYVRDRKRARQCLQKAFELSPSELEAAERLARSFADQGDWDIVEVIAQRAIDSGKCRPSPGSKKKGVSWPFSALGIVQMNKQEYNKSVISFLSALRISPDDYNSYVGLGESYHNSGRYNSALRTFRYAEEPTDGMQMKRPAENWFTKYMLANVNRELGQYDEAIDSYKAVLETRPAEFGVSIALLQTLIERGWRQLETGFFGKAADSAVDALTVAKQVAEYKPEAFNLWKAVGDACSLFSWVRSCLDKLPLAHAKALLETGFDTTLFDLFSETDGIGQAQHQGLSEEPESPAGLLRKCLEASILAHKRAIHACSQDVHAQAVSWYNLGWAELRAHLCCEQDVDPISKGKTNLKQIKAAMRCFKRAIELEASNTEFWNALGIVTTELNPKVAQHSFVRSLHLNERNVKTWTNLGVLYLLQNDYELAHMAFSRAQSTDPDYAQAWLGEGLIAVLLGDGKEALSHFTHAFEISDSSSLVVKRQYAASTFDHLLSSPSASNNITHLIQPLFALQQVRSQNPSDIPHAHLAALYLERVGSHAAATSALESICATAESDFEVSESPATLSRFAQAKADLARNRLASGDFGAAVDDAQLALDLLADDDTGLPADARRKVLLGARLTVGLASYYQHDMDGAIAAFRAALEESQSAPDVVCALAEVLWAKGGAEERDVARAQLFDAVAAHPQHVGAVLLLGAMAAVEDERDEDTLDALRDDLMAIRARADVDDQTRAKVETLLFAFAALSPSSSTSPSASSASASLTAAQQSVFLQPAAPLGWRLLSEVAESDEDAVHAAQMALLTARRGGAGGAVELAEAYAAGGLSVADAQRAVWLAPWRASGWGALGEVKCS